MGEIWSKTLASIAITPNTRAQQVQADTEKRAHDLDLKYPFWFFQPPLPYSLSAFATWGPPRTHTPSVAKPQLSILVSPLKYPGSTFTQVLKSPGKDGRYLVLVVGPFANLSDYFMVLCDFLGRARALKAMNSWSARSTRWRWTGIF